MKTDNYDRLVCTQSKELFKLCFFYTEENLNLFSLAELREISDMCKDISKRADDIISDRRTNLKKRIAEYKENKQWHIVNYTKKH